MNSGKRTIIKNASLLMLTQIITWVMSFLLTMVQSRYLRPAGMGQLYIGNSIWFILSMFITFGMNTVITKEIARNPERTSELTGTSLILRGLLYVPVMVVLAVYLALANYPTDTIYIILIIGVSNLIWQVAAVFDAALQGLERMEFISLGNTIGKIVHAVVVATFCFLGGDIFVIVSVSAFGPLLVCITQFIGLIRLKKIHFDLDWPRMMWMMKSGVPFLLSGLFLILYSNIDAVVISLLVNEQTVGWYGAADQLYATLLFIPTILTQALFPSLTRAFNGGELNFSSMLSKSLNLLLMTAVPMCVGLLVIARPVMVLIYGNEYAPGGGVLAVLGFVLIFMYINILLGRFLIATDRQNAWTLVMAIATVATIPLDILLIPWCHQSFGNGAIGGALSYLITESLMAFIGFRLLPKGLLDNVDIWSVGKIVGASLIMGVSIWWLRDTFILLPVSIGIIVYSGLTLLLRIVPQDDLTMILNMAGSFVQRIRTRFLEQPRVN